MIVIYKIKELQNPQAPTIITYKTINSTLSKNSKILIKIRDRKDHIKVENLIIILFMMKKY